MRLSLALLLALACVAHANDSARFYEDCTTTTMRLENRKRFVGGDVYRSVKLVAGQGTLYCMNLCRADENCWSFNLNKNRKVCFLQTDSDAPSQRASTWASGYRECVPSEGNWDNPNTSAADDAATLTTATGTTGGVDFIWTLAANDAYYTATYKAILVANDATCYDTPLASKDTAAGATSASITGLSFTGNVDAYIQTVVDGTIRGCSAKIDASVK